jgi:putative membrane protein
MRKGFLPNFIMLWLITAIAVAVAVWIVPGIRVSQPHPIWTILVVALVLGLINAFIRPVLYALSCGLIVLTLGLFTVVINGLMLWLASYVTSNGIGLEFHVSGFWSAVFGALIISIVSTIVSLVVGEKRK